MLRSRKLSAFTVALALVGLGSVIPSAPASAQAIFASPRAATAAHVAYHGNAETANAAAPADDTTTPADPYAAIFAQVQTAVTGLLSGPGALAFGILILGLGFGVAWRLVTKGTKSIAK